MHKLLIKDAFWQILGRIISALGWFLVVKIMTPYFGPLRFGDYSTILKYFAIWSAFADFGLYVIALRRLGELKDSLASQEDMKKYYGKFVMSRFTTITIVYTVALIVAYMIPAYTSNPYLVRGLPLGMIFSASFMTAGILQLPLQLYRWMKHVSIALTLARIAQVLVMLVIVYFYQNIDFSAGGSRSVAAFLLMIGTVIVSAWVQWIYVWLTWNRHIKLTLKTDRRFTWDIIKDNWQYGLAYCLSSMHTLGVMILIGIYYPTVDKFTYVGMRAVASALMEILLIVPSSLGNSIIPKISGFTQEHMRRVFWSLLLFILWIGWVFYVNFSVFRETIIRFVSWTDYLAAHTGTRGADTILPWLALVLLIGFVKQVYNFLFVALHLNNKLLRVNGIGVAIGAMVWFYAVPRYGIAWGIVTQIVMEVCYTLGWIRIAHAHKAPLLFSWKRTLGILIGIAVFAIWGRWVIWSGVLPLWHLIAWWIAINALIFAISFKPIKAIMRGFNG
jgi:O-antigen/teichoic acid export membrane protein